MNGTTFLTDALKLGKFLFDRILHKLNYCIIFIFN